MTCFDVGVFLKGAPLLVACLLDLNLGTSKEFELVLDPFMGSGTTRRVCDKLNRSFVGYDLNRYP